MSIICSLGFKMNTQWFLKALRGHQNAHTDLLLRHLELSAPPITYFSCNEGEYETKLRIVN